MQEVAPGVSERHFLLIANGPAVYLAIGLTGRASM